jgi:hypothetical protein
MQTILIPEEKQLVRTRLHDVRELVLSVDVGAGLLSELKSASKDVWNYTGIG